MSVLAEVEEALGPGIDFERDGRRMIGRRARAMDSWPGLDRAAVVDSDDGHGRRVPLLVATPTSTFAGAMLEVDLVGGWRTRASSILLGVIPGHPAPTLDAAMAVGRVHVDSEWMGAEMAAHAVKQARQRFKERSSHARIVSGRAWFDLEAQPPELSRFATPYSAAEYSLRRLPTRFVRGLEGLLDDDERLLYWVERPQVLDPGLVTRLRAKLDRRAALLVLSDRQLLWMVDHAQPDRYLSDWGVDVALIPVERVSQVDCGIDGTLSHLTVLTPAGQRRFVLPAELVYEVGVMRELLERFTPSAAGHLPRRIYRSRSIAFDAEPAARYGQQAEARALFDAGAIDEPPLAFLFSPKRPGQGDARALVLTSKRIVLLGKRPMAVALRDVASIEETLSPLLGRIAFDEHVDLVYPSPLVDRGARFVREARRVLAMTR